MVNTQQMREVRKLTQAQKRAREEKVKMVREGQAVKDKNQKEKTTKMMGK